MVCGCETAPKELVAVVFVRSAVITVIVVINEGPEVGRKGIYFVPFRGSGLFFSSLAQNVARRYFGFQFAKKTRQVLLLVVCV